MTTVRAQRMVDSAPDYYQQAAAYIAIQQAVADELDAEELDDADVQLQLSATTATWGLTYWEETLKIPVVVADGYEVRRSRVLGKLRGVGNFSADLIKSIAESYSGGEVEVYSYLKNMIPPFTDPRWTLHENTRMKLATFAGKIAGSVIENPHRAYFGYDIGLRNPSGFTTEVPYSNIATLNGVLDTRTNGTVGYTSQHLFSFDLIQHVIRNYGAAVFGTAVTTADRVAWLKTNLSKCVGNWWGFGSSFNGNKAYWTWWNATSNAWVPYSSTTSGAVAKLAIPNSNVAAIDANGFVHFNANADPSNGTVASVLNTDYVELEVYFKPGVLPVKDYEIETQATGASQYCSIDLPVIPGQTYTVSGKVEGTGGVIGRNFIDASGATIGAYVNLIRSHTNPVAIQAPSNAAKIRLYLNTEAPGPYTFKNPMLQMGNHTQQVTQSDVTNFVGKVSGSTVENPHTAKRNSSPTLITPSGSWVELNNDGEQRPYSVIATLNGVSSVQSSVTNTIVSQQIFSFDLIQHVIRKYGAAVFGNAVTTADRVAWLKLNVTEVVGDWWGFGSGPSGNKAYWLWWNGSAWQTSVQTSHTSGTVQKLSRPISSSLTGAIDGNGFVHFLAYADASNGTTASVINTDSVELQVNLSYTAFTSKFEPRKAYTIGIKFIGARGVPENLADLQAQLADIVHANLQLEYFFSFLTWEELSAAGVTWDELDALNLTWEEFETYRP